MVDAARARGIDAHRGDVADWTPAPDTDVVITNAVLQWVPQHRELLPRWLAALPRGAELAMQVPGNFGAPSHTLVARARGAGGASQLRGEGAVAEPAEYAALLAATGAEVDVWETTYLHRADRPGPGAGVDRLDGPAARCATPSTTTAYASFRAELAPRLRAAYPARPDGTTWFPFRRIFAVARVR